MKLLEQLLDFVVKRKAQAYLVGGCVRDLLMGRERYDIDVAVSASASPLARAFADEIHGSFYVMDEENDVARVVLEAEGVRYYVDFARVRGESIEQDLATRDFTLNAMALDISSGAFSEAALIDPFDGREDLAAGRLRSVASSVFENDPVRLLRGVRFEATLGFALDPETESFVRRDARQLVDATPERVRDEFCRIIAAEGSLRNLGRLDELGLFPFFLPEVTALKGVVQAIPHTYDVFEHSIQAVGAFEEIERSHFLNLAEGAFSQQLELHFAETLTENHRRGMLLRIALLLHDSGKLSARKEEEDSRARFLGHEASGAKIAELALRRLRFSNEEIALVSTIIAQHLRPRWLAAGAAASDLAVFRFFRATGKAGVDVAIHSWCDQRATYGHAEYAVPEAELQAVIARLLDRYYHAHDKIVEPPQLLNGREVMKALGLESGPRVGELLDALREAEAAGDVNNREQAIEFLRVRNGENASGDAAAH
jgi:tRNA nucleotidyltransferase/poly(A) polymerase